jgi:hypothetical protein
MWFMVTALVAALSGALVEAQIVRYLLLFFF